MKSSSIARRLIVVALVTIFLTTSITLSAYAFGWRRGATPTPTPDACDTQNTITMLPPHCSAGLVQTPTLTGGLFEKTEAERGVYSFHAMMSNEVMLGDGTLEFHLPQGGTAYVGLTETEPWCGYDSVDYLFNVDANYNGYPGGSGIYYIREWDSPGSGVNAGGFSNAQPPIVFRIERQGNTVTYFADNAVYAVSNKHSTAPLHAYVLLYAPNTQVQVTQFSAVGGLKVRDNVPLLQEVTWQNPINVTVNGNSITKTSGASEGYDAGASSIQQVTGDNSFYRFKAVATENNFLAALALDDTTASFPNAFLSLYFSYGSLYDWVNGLGANLGTFDANSEFEVAIDNGALVYYRRDPATGARTPMTGSGAKIKFPFLFDTSLRTTGSGVRDVMFGQYPYVNPCDISPDPTPTPTPPPPAEADLVATANSQPYQVEPGATLVFNNAVTNNGPSLANNVSVDVYVPPYTQLDSYTAPGGTCQTTTYPNDAGHSVVCSFGDLGVGEVRNVTVNVTITAIDGASMQAITTVSNATPDPNSANNTAYAPLIVRATSNGKIVFVSYGDQAPDIYTINPDGTGLTNLTNTAALEQMPAFSPDGNKIAFSRDSRLHLMNWDGSNPTLLSAEAFHNGYALKWSPDGSKIAFDASYQDAGGQEIAVINADGTGQLRLTNEAGSQGNFVWSPDSTRLVYDSVDGDIHMVNADGTGQVNLTNSPETEIEVSWSPDGGRIAFTRILSNYTIFTMNPDGTGQTQLSSGTAQDHDPVFSPDGTRIAFRSYRNGGFDPFVMNTDGNNETRVVDADMNVQYSIEWSPDSKKILFVDSPDGITEMYVVNLDGSGLVNVSNNPTAYDENYDWQNSVAVVTPTPGADLSSSASAANPNYVQSGAQVSVTASLVNNGWSSAVNATLAGQAPAGVTIDTTVANDGSPCAIAPGGASFNCTFASVNSNETRSVAVTATATGAPYTLHTVTFTVASETLDPNANNNVSVAQFYIASPPVPTPTPGPVDELQLAYTKFDNATFQGDIFRQRADAAELLNLTNSGVDESGFSWTPDGSKIVFLRLDFANRTASSYVMAADGSNLVQLTNVAGEYISQIVWSPDSSKLIFSVFPYSNDSPDGQIYVINADGTGRTNVSGTDGFNSEPAWSPDGSKISFKRNPTPTSAPNSDLYVANADGTNAIQIAHGPDERDSAATWSPDGTRLAFTRSFPDNTNQVYTVQPDGNGALRVINAADTTTSDPQWSPDGRLSLASFNTSTFATALEAANYDGSGRVTIYSPPQGGSYYALSGWKFSPNGSRVAFSYIVGEGQGANVCVVNADGTGLFCIGSSDQEYNTAPDWSPDGARLAFVSNRNGVRTIDLVNADGTGRVELTTGDVFGPKWRPVPQGNTPAGTNVTITANGATVTFSDVTQRGETTITPIDPNSLSGVPGEYVINANSLAFEIHTTAVYSGPITIGFQVPGVNNPITFSALRVLHGEPPPVPNFVDRTVLSPDTPAPDFATRTIYARVTSLSPFIVLERRVDAIAPVTTATLSTPANAAGWHKTNPTVTLSATDNAGGSGVKSITYSATGAQPIAQTTVAGSSAAITITTEGITTLTYRATDALGNVESAKSITVRLDKTAPSITITRPAGSIYLLHQVVTASFQCTDGGSGSATCTGTVANGAAFNTTSVGAKTFTVNATDVAGNTLQQSVNYTVTYGINPLFDQTKANKSGSTIPIKLELVDAAGVNCSAASIVVTATGVVRLSNNAPGELQDPGNSNPDFNFNFSGGKYQFNLKTTGYATGTYRLDFQVSGDPITHSVQFQIK